jgi:hypothetical protein
MAKKQQPTFWSTSTNGRSCSGGDGYSSRNSNKKASGQGCVILLVVGASIVASLGYFVPGWLS